MILISVDLPAPLSPNGQWTSPALTEKSRRSRASTEPKDFEMPRNWIIDWAATESPRGGCTTADEVVEQDGEQHHHAQEYVEEIGIDTRIENSDLHRAVDQRPEEGSDRRSVASGQQRASDDD